MRTDGSLIKAPGVVCRPVQSISWRSIIRIGETVLVPIGCSLTRCGISEPVMKTVRSSTFCSRFEARLPVGSARTLPANMLATMKIVAPEAVSVFTNESTAGKVRRANYRNDDGAPLHKSKRGNGCCHYLSAGPNQSFTVRISSLGARKQNGR